MTIEEIIPRIKKNKFLDRKEKRELIDFWTTYKCPIEGHELLVAHYHDGEVETNTVQELNYWYDETPHFIETFFKAMAEGKEFTTRFAVYNRASILAS